MKQFLRVFLGGIVASMILFGCKGGDGPQGPAGTALTGNLFGKVAAYDSFGNYLGLMSVVTVTAEGTGYAGVSDSLGAWVIAGLPTGTYNLTFSKPGYGTNKITQFQFVGRGDYYYTSTAYIGGIPNFEPATATVAIAAGSLNVTGTLTGGSPPYQRRVNVYIGKTAAINPAVPSTYVTYFTDYVASSTNNYDLAVNVAAIMSSYGYVTGGTIYVAVYSTGLYSWTYYDYASAKSVETALGSVVKAGNAVIP